MSKWNAKDEDSQWLPVSDLMSGLMIIFIFIALSFMRSADIERNEIKEIIVLANDTQVAIYQALEAEFHDDLTHWNAELDPETITVRFKEPDILFERSAADIKQEFKIILADFFPRYVAVLSAFYQDIEEIRIEGHTSSEWNTDTSLTKAYFLNMELSQKRARVVLEFCYSLAKMENYLWLKSKLSAVGLSSARLITDANQQEDPARSRRVEFTVKTNFEKRIIQSVSKS